MIYPIPTYIFNNYIFPKIIFATNIKSQNIYFPTLCPKGTRKSSNLYSSPKCWHDISKTNWSPPPPTLGSSDQFWPFLPFLSVFDYFWQIFTFLTVFEQNLLTQFWPIFDHILPILTILDHFDNFCQFLSIFGNLRPFDTCWTNFWTPDRPPQGTDKTQRSCLSFYLVQRRLEH